MPCPRGGGCRAISRPQTKTQCTPVVDPCVIKATIPNYWPDKIEAVSAPFRSTGTCSEIRPGDVLIVVRLDRLGRNTRENIDLAKVKARLGSADLPPKCDPVKFLPLVSNKFLSPWKSKRKRPATAGEEHARAGSRAWFRRRPRRRQHSL